MRVNILIGITISMLLVCCTLQAAASDYTLGVFGNANEDDTVNMQDVTYTELIILEYRDETELADAKYDGKINMQDVTQIELTILGREKELTFLDANEDDITVSKPIDEIVVLNTDVADAIRALGAKDRIVGVTTGMTEATAFFPDLSSTQSIGKWSSPDIEAVLTLNPDVIFAFGSYPNKEILEDKLEGSDITVVRLDLYKIYTLREELEILGYLLGEQDNAREYLTWYDECVDGVDGVVSGISEDDKPDVFLFSGSKTTDTSCKSYGIGTGMDELCLRAGGNSIAADLEGYPEVEAEWILNKDSELGIDVMLGLTYKGGYETDDASAVAEEYDNLVGMPGFSEIAAVNKDRVNLIDGDLAFAPGQPAALVYTAKWFYPDLFEDTDPQAIHQEYIDKFCDIDFDVAEHGVFVYPQSKS
jgi:iron complex transport system substrate-binding protein